MYFIEFLKEIYNEYKGFRDGRITKEFIAKHGDKYISCITCQYYCTEESKIICNHYKKRYERFGKKIWVPSKKLRKSVNF